MADYKFINRINHRYRITPDTFPAEKGIFLWVRLTVGIGKTPFIPSSVFTAASPIVRLKDMAVGSVYLKIKSEAQPSPPIRFV
jgi:hypothetical protein